MYIDDVIYEYRILENEVDMIKINMFQQFINCLIGPIWNVCGLLVNNVIPIIQKIVDDNEVNAKIKKIMSNKFNKI